MKTWKGFGKLACKGALVLLPMIALWAYIWVAPIRYMDREVANHMWNSALVTTTQAKRYDVIILGDSMANAGMVPEILSEKTLNLALSGQSPIEQYYVLKKYLEHNDRPNVCYIAFDDGHFSISTALFQTTLYSHDLSWKNVWEIRQNAIKYNERELSNISDYLPYEERSLAIYLPAIMNSGLSGRKNSNLHTFENMTKHRGTYVARTVKEYIGDKQTEIKELKVHPLFNMYYQKMIQLCGQYGIQVRVIKLPKPTFSYNEDSVIQHKSFFYDLQNEYPFVTTVWIKNGFRPDDFVDSFHLNNHGSYKLSQLLKSVYPKDFADDSPISRETIDGLTDYLQMENEPGFILRWMENRNFAALFLFRHGAEAGKDPELAKAIEECGYGSAFTTPAVSSFGTQEFYAAGDHHAGTFSATDDTFTLQEEDWNPIRVKDEEYFLSADFPEMEKPQVIAKSDATDLSVVILNNYDHRVVAVKNFVYMHGRYVLMKDK